jgi:hypothetical protein
MHFLIGNELCRYTLTEPPYLREDQVLTFVYTPSFTQDWREFLLNDDDLPELELGIMVACSMDSSETGLRNIIAWSETGANRHRPINVSVFYVHFPGCSLAAILAADPPNGEWIVTDDDRKQLAPLIKEISDEFEQS